MIAINRRNVLLLGILGGTGLLAAPHAHAATPDCTATGAAEATGNALLDKYLAAINAHDTGSLPQLFPESYIQNSGRSPSGLAAQIENWRRIFAAMPDVVLKIEDRIIAGEKVVARNAFSATHSKPLQGIAPTGRRFVLKTIDIWRVENGKLAEHWDIVDTAGLVKQLRGE